MNEPQPPSPAASARIRERIAAAGRRIHANDNIAEFIGGAAERERAAAVEKCKANRGVDCDKPGAINQWVQQDRPMTAEQQRAAIAARNAREAAARRY